MTPEQAEADRLRDALARLEIAMRQALALLIGVINDAQEVMRGGR